MYLLMKYMKGAWMKVRYHTGIAPFPPLRFYLCSDHNITLLLHWFCRFPVDCTERSIITAPWFEVDIDECYSKCGTILKLFWRSPHYPHSCELLCFCTEIKSLTYCINSSFPSFIDSDEAVLFFQYFIFSNANSGIHTSSESTFSGRYIGEVRLQVDLKQSAWWLWPR